MKLGLTAIELALPALQQGSELARLDEHLFGVFHRRGVAAKRR